MTEDLRAILPRRVATRCWAVLLGGALPLTASCMGMIGDGVGHPSSAHGPENPGDGTGGMVATSGLLPGTGGGPATVVPLAQLVGMNGLRRLTDDELDNTLDDLLFEGARATAERLPADKRAPFDNDYRAQRSSTAFVDGMELLVKESSGRLLADTARRDRVVGCVPKNQGEWSTCFTQFVKKFGRRALRRPLPQDEVALYTPLLDVAKNNNGNFYDAVDMALRAFLQDPEFLYRAELGTRVNGNGMTGVFKLSSWEVASRLAYFVWGSTPSDKLLDLAEADQLGSAAGVRTAARDMIADPRAKARVSRFHSMWMGFEQLNLPPVMKAETNALVERVVFEKKLPWQELLFSQETLVSYELGKLYGLQLPATLKAGSSPAWVRYDGTERRGILSQGSFLAVGASDDNAAPIKRGKAVRTRLLCLPMSDPTPEIQKMIDEVKMMPTTSAPCRKDKLESHRANGGCAGCHKLMDPMGFGLDRYDSQGRFRLYDRDPKTGRDITQCPISGDGALPDIGPSNGSAALPFNGPAGLADLLVSSGRFADCGAMQLYRLATGRAALDDTDMLFVGQLRNRMGAKEFRLDDLLVELASMEAFLYRREDK